MSQTYESREISLLKHWMQRKNSRQESLQLLSVTSQMDKLTIHSDAPKRTFRWLYVLTPDAFSNFMWNQQALCPAQRQVSAGKAEETTMNFPCG